MIFVGDKAGFEEKKVGYYYVFNKGNKIDFNHPNRKGHLSIANEISKKRYAKVKIFLNVEFKQSKTFFYKGL